MVLLRLLLALAVAGLIPPLAAPPLQANSPLTVRITSPLGRTGTFGAIRVVAQLRPAPDPELPPPAVRFFVDDKPIGEDADGPPYAVEWIDENPFERRAISVEVDAAGVRATDRIELEPFEITEVSEVVSVLLEATVEDARGRAVLSLGKDAFSLEENGEPQTLDVVHAEVMPATYLLLLDSSQSMARRIDYVKRAASRLTAHLRPEDRVIVAPFSRRIGVLTGPTADRDTILDAIGHVGAGGGTAILDCLAEAARLMGDMPGRHAIVLLTDGYDEHSTRSAAETLTELKRSNTTVYVVGIGGIAGVSIRGERFLRDLANQSSGRVFFPTRNTELPPVYDHIAEDVRQRYLVTYTPTNRRRDGAWRTITLKGRDPDWKIRTRPGYFAPAPPPVRPSIEFTVVGAANGYLDVSRDDLVIVEDGVPQVVDTFQEAVAPVSVLLTLDQSGSMTRAASAVQEAAREFVTRLRPTDSLGVSLFADAAALAQDLTTNRDAALEAVGQYVARGGTALYDALAAGVERLERVEGRRVVVVLTDGRDENNAGTAPGSLRKFDEVLAAARDKEVTVFTIGLGPNVDRDRLQLLASTTGGLALFPSDVTQLAGEYERIVENLRRRYVVSYSSTNTARDGSWRSVEIRSHLPDTSVASRGGYYAPDDGN